MITKQFLASIRTQILSHADMRDKISNVYTYADSCTEYPYILLEVCESDELLNRIHLTCKINIYSATKGIEQVIDLSNTIKNILGKSSVIKITENISAAIKKTAERIEENKGIHQAVLIYKVFIKQ